MKNVSIKIFMNNMFDELQKYLLYYNVNFSSTAIDKKEQGQYKKELFRPRFKKTIVLVEPRI